MISRPILENRVWYRVLKVVYFLIIGVISLIAIYILNDTYKRKFDNMTSYIECSNGDRYDLSANSIYLYSDYISSYNEETFTHRCNQHNKGKTNTFRLISKYIEKDWESIWKYLILTGIIMYGVTEVLKRTLYYIVLGTIFPLNSGGSSTHKKCVNCGENILNSAKKCRFCGKWQ